MPERQCFGCKKQEEWGCEADYRVVPPKTPDARKNRNGEWQLWHQPARLPLTINDEDTYACPRQDIHRRAREWNRMLLFYGFYKKGHLPQAGAILDQANKGLEIFRIFDDMNAECDRAQMEDERKKQTRGQPNVR